MIFWTAGEVLVQVGLHLDTPTKNYSNRIIGFVFAIGLPLTAAIEPKSLYTDENFIVVVNSIFYLQSELENLDFRFFVTSVSSWAVYWAYNKETFCSENVYQQTSCPRFYNYIIQFLVNGLLIFNTYRYVKRVNTLLKSQKEDRLAIERHLKTQEKLNAELKKTLEMNDNFLMAFSHELKNPLNALLGSIELALDEFISDEMRFLLTNAQLSGRMLLHLLTNILDSGKIQLNKLDVNPQKGNFLEYLENFWHTTSMLIKPKGLSGFLSIGKNFPTQLLFDSHRLSQNLLNLVSNSLKFTGKGQIGIVCSFEKGSELPAQKFEPKCLSGLSTNDEELSQGDKNNSRNTAGKRNLMSRMIVPQNITTDNTKDNEKFELDLQRKSFPQNFFKKQLRSKEGYVRIEIVDSGCGMSPQELNQLFQKFSQVSENTTKRQIGTGLGLWITKELCELMKGDIKVSSIKGVGTSFVCLIKTQSFPDEIQKSLSKKTQAHAPHLNIESAISLKVEKGGSFHHRSVCVAIPVHSSNSRYLRKTASSKKVLIAEDLINNQEIYKQMLKKEAVEVIIVNDGAEAIRVFKDSPPESFQFLLFDLNMPNLDGISASKEIREYEAANKLNSVKIVIATGNCTQETRTICLDPQGSVRAFDVLIKSVTQANIFKLCELTKKKQFYEIEA